VLPRVMDVSVLLSDGQFRASTPAVGRLRLAVVVVLDVPLAAVVPAAVAD
jgi:hypothetical protein